MLPALFGDLTMPLDDDSYDFLLAWVDVDNLNLAVFETENEVTSSG